MTAKRPVVFLAFANDMDSHLATLKDESRAVYDALQPLEQANAVDVHREESAEFDELYQDLLDYSGRIVVFHYAGHADGTMLQLEGGNGDAGGIAKLLGQQTSLKLVFLNGCATKDQVKLLHDAGVPAVIATAVKISDTKATKLATAFYDALVKGYNIFGAFESARGYIEGKFDGDAAVKLTINRHPNFDFGLFQQDNNQPDNNQSLEFEWTLYAREDCVADLEQWRLTHAQQEWLLELRDTSGVIRDLDDNPIKIEHQARARTLDVLACLNCDLSTSLNQENQLQCPLCASSNVNKQQAQSNIPAQKLPFDIDKQQALDIALAAAGLAELGSEQNDKISLRKVYVPFWVFELDTRSHLSAQRGVIKDIHANTLTLEWQDVNQDIDLALEAYMVPGFIGQTSVNIDPDDWHWSLDETSEISQLDLAIPFIPFEVSPQAGFNSVVEYLSEELANEAADRIGGQQQKNIVFNTRYKHLSLSSVFLPHWCVVFNHEQPASSIIINGQTGAIRFSQSADKPALANLGQSSMNQKRLLKHAAAEKVASWISVFSGMGIGVMVGMLMGLAAPQGGDAKSVVAIFIGAIGVGLAALLGLNDRHFSAAKGLRIGSFGLAVTVSALSGIYVRDNHILSPSIAERAGEYKFAIRDITNEQLMALLVTTTTTTKADGSTKQITGPLLSMSALFSKGVSLDTCKQLNNPNYDADDFSAEEVLFEFESTDKQNTSAWRNLAAAVKKEMQDANADRKAMLLMARDSLCASNKLQKVTPKSPECNKINKAIDSAAMEKLLNKEGKLHPILTRIDNKISKKNKDVALMLLKPVLCSSSEEK